MKNRFIPDEDCSSCFSGADSKKHKSVLESDELRFKKKCGESEAAFEFLAWADRHSDDSPQEILPFHENNSYQRFPFEPRAYVHIFDVRENMMQE